MTGPGIHTMPAPEYHADPAERPSLSAGIARLLISSSPRHAWTAHPRLNPDYKSDADAKWDVGTVAHALLLQGEDVAVVVDAPDWRTKAAKEERDAARAAGQVPLLSKDWDAVQAMISATRSQLDAVDADPPLFTDGKPEQTIVWEETGDRFGEWRGEPVLCRARLDWLHDDLSAVDDYKSTSRSANPESWSRTMFGIGCDVQVAFYLRGLEALTGAADVEWRYAVQETYPPYALSVVSLAPDALALGREKVERAIQTWRACVETDTWPAYPPRVSYLDAPAWEETRWLEQQVTAEAAAK